MLIRAQLIAILLSVGLLLGVFVLVRRGSLRDQYALLWLFIGTVAVIVSSIPARIWDVVARFLGVESGRTLLLVIGLFAVIALILQLSMAVTRLERLVVSHILEERVQNALDLEESREDR